MILDSGERRQFETGAVRDIVKGKGRCDLLPLEEVSDYLEYLEIKDIADFKKTGDIGYLHNALDDFKIRMGEESSFTLMLEVARQFEEGAEKYGVGNWQKGIPIHCYMDSAIRHLLKYCAGWNDEPHHRAFIWNIICAIWTFNNKPELDDFTDKGGNEDESC